MNRESNSALPAVGLIGVTGYARTHFSGIRFLVEQNLARWAAVTIVNPEDAPDAVTYFKNLNVPIYNDYKAMLAQHAHELNWVSVPTGIGWHRPMVLDCLNSGINAFVEKPLAPTPADVDAIRAAEAESGKQCLVGFQHIYRQSTHAIKRILQERRLGTLRRMVCYGLWPRPTSYYERNEWAGAVRTNGTWILDSPFNNALAHGINMMLFLAGDHGSSAKPVAFESECYRVKPIRYFDTIWTRALTASGTALSAVLSHSSTRQVDPEIHIFCDDGKIVWRWFGDHSISTAEGFDSIAEPPENDLHRDLFLSVNSHFAGNPSPVVCTTEMAAQHVLWTNAIYAASPIVDIPSSFTFQHNRFENAFFSIEDIEYWALRAAHENTSFSALGAPWACGTQTINADQVPPSPALCEPASIA